MTFKDLEDWQKKLMVKDLKDGENIYIEYTKDDIIAGLKTENQGLKKQQKEFIEYLEDKLCVINNLLNTEQDEAKVYYLIVRRTAFDEILSKYKEIIGGDNK